MSGSASAAPHDDAVVAVHSALYRALAPVRVVVLLNSVVLVWVRQATFAHPLVADAVMIGLGIWTAVALLAYSRPALRKAPLLAVDMAVALGTMLVSPWVEGPGWLSTLPGFWVAGVVLAWAIAWRLIGGMVGSLLVAGADVAIREQLTQTNIANILLILLSGSVVGYLTGLVLHMARERERAERQAAVAAERARLARVVHDGILQVLALVQRRGIEIGGEAAELGRLAGEQEAALRTLVHRPEGAAEELRADREDLAERLLALERETTPTVRFIGPGHRVEMPAERVEEAVALVWACLQNVADHVGRQATAWVLLEDLGERVVLTVRDEGPGIPDGRLEEAAAEGRLGVSESIRGRVDGQGGCAGLSTGVGQGTEWEFELPKEAP